MYKELSQQWQNSKKVLFKKKKKKKKKEPQKTCHLNLTPSMTMI